MNIQVIKTAFLKECSEIPDGDTDAVYEIARAYALSHPGISHLYEMLIEVFYE